MDKENFIVRRPLLDPRERVLGYELAWQGKAAGSADRNALVDLVASLLHHPESGWMLGDAVLSLPAAPALLTIDTVEALPPKKTIFKLNAVDLDDPQLAEAVRPLRERGFGIAADYFDLNGHDQSIFRLLSHVDVEVADMDVAMLAKLAAALKQASIETVARDVSNWTEFDTSASLRLNAFVGDFYLESRPGTTAKGLNPAQTIILQLMQLVRENEDIHKLEDVLRRDAAVSYKLLRYINSVGFGLGSEIQSLRHAVTMLGYSPLYRWLSLLLATASTNGHSQALMQTAVIRGRFAELLGQDYLPANEVENLFVAGMFSLLDRLLGMPMEEVLESIQLPDAISEALLTRGGVYGPFVALAEACEPGGGKIAPLADSLFLGARQVNEAHLAALAWVQSLQL